MRKGPYGPLSFAVATRFIGQFVANSGTNTILRAPAIYPVGNGLGTPLYLCCVDRTLGAVVGDKSHKRNQDNERAVIVPVCLKLLDWKGFGVSLAAVQVELMILVTALFR